MSQTEHIQQRLRPLYDQLATHPLYGALQSLEDLHLFMESHVFAVWDFMSLLKNLQRELTCVRLPWTPSAMAESRRLINEIVLGEESDLYEGRALSHFEIYCLAMERCGASTAAIRTLVVSIMGGSSLEQALAICPQPAPAAFVRDTFAVLAQGKTHTAAAAFTFGREDLIPDMFKGFVASMNNAIGGKLATFLWYLERHIEVDGEEHGPMALRMVEELCGADPEKWAEAETAAVLAVESRLRLWDGILAAIRERQRQLPSTP